MDLCGVAFLAGPHGAGLVSDLLSEGPYRADRSLELAGRVRARLEADGVDPALTPAVLTQYRLRSRGRDKLGPLADRLLLTEAGAEQATRPEVAAAHARRFTAAGATCVADLGCGIGLDSRAFAEAGLAVLAVEADPVTAAVARVNLGEFSRATVLEGDVLALDPTRVPGPRPDAFFADPARRTGGAAGGTDHGRGGRGNRRGGRGPRTGDRGARPGGRVFDPAQYSPPLDAVLALPRRWGTDALGVKVAPGLPYDAIPAAAHASWVSVDGDVLEAGLWLGPLAPEGPGRSAVVHRAGTGRTLALPGDPSAPAEAAPVRAPGAYLHEPDGAAIRAGGVAELARRLDAGVVAPDIAYLTGDFPANDDAAPFVTSYAVLDVLPFHVGRLKAYLRERGVGRLTIKKRGTDVLPEDLRARLAPKGPAEATLVVSRVGDRHGVLVVERVERPARDAAG